MFSRRPNARLNRGRIGSSSAVLSPESVSSASASVGPFPTSGDKFSVSGAGGPDIPSSTTLGVLFEIYTNTQGVAQTLWSYCSSTTGWYFSIDGGTNNLSMIVRNAGVSTAYVLSNDHIDVGLHCVFFSRDAGNNLLVSVDGEDAVTLTAAFAYTTNGAGAQNIIGGVNTALVASGFPCVAARVLGVAHINAATNAATLKTYSALTNATERYLWPSTITGHANAVSVWHATDWNGSSGTTTAGFGSAPTTWTKAGTIAKNTIGAEKIYAVQDSWFFDAGPSSVGTYTGGVGTYTMRNSFARFKLSISPAPSRIGVVAAADVILLGSGTWAPTSLRIDGIPAGTAGNGIQPNGVGLLRATDWLPGNFSAGTVYEFIDGLNNRNTTNGVRRGVCIQKIRLPSDVSARVISPSATANRLLVCGDSITLGSGINAPGTAAWTMLMRQNRGGVKMWAAGSEQYYDLCLDASTITATVTAIGAQLDGTSTNTIWFAYGTNDWGKSPPVWADAGTDFQAQVAALFDALHTAYPSLVFYVQTPIKKASEGANANGDTLADFRTALTTIASTRAWINLIDGTTFCPMVASPSAVNLLQSDDVHPTQAGNAYMERRAAAILGYTSVNPWNSSGGIYRDANITRSWVADTAYTGGGATCSTWTAEKGGTNFAGTGADPAWAANYGTANLGVLTFNGTTQAMKADAVAPAISGSSLPWTMTISIQPVTIAVKVIASFDNSDTTKGFHDIAMNTGGNRITNTRQKDDPAASTSLNTTDLITTSRQVWSFVYNGTTLTVYLNGTVTSINAATQNQQAMTVNQFTIGAFREGNVLSLFANVKIRTILFVAAALDDTSRQINEGFLLSEVA